MRVYTEMHTNPSIFKMHDYWLVKTKWHACVKKSVFNTMPLNHVIKCYNVVCWLGMLHAIDVLGVGYCMSMTYACASVIVRACAAFLHKLEVCEI